MARYGPAAPSGGAVGDRGGRLHLSRPVRATRAVFRLRLPGEELCAMRSDD